jgi:Holliday junction resolvase
MSRYARAVDRNQGEIVTALRSVGCEVAITSALGGGFPDLTVLHRGRVVLFEVKDPDKPPSAKRLTDAERDFARKWQGAYFVVECPEDCFRVLGLVVRA